MSENQTRSQAMSRAIREGESRGHILSRAWTRRVHTRKGKSFSQVVTTCPRCARVALAYLDAETGRWEYGGPALVFDCTGPSAPPVGEREA
jgi:hypothetical protein